MATVKKGLREPGWTTNLAPLPNISMSDVVLIIQKHSKVPNKHLDKGYKFFHGSYVHDVEVKVNTHGCNVRSKCYRSMRKNETAWTLNISLLNTKEIASQSCGCGAGKGSCAHVAALVYQLAHYKTLKMKTVPDIVSKTSCPQQWQVPPRTHGIKPRHLNDVKFVKPKANSKSESCVCSTLYNPVNTDFPDVPFMTGLAHILPFHDQSLQLLQVLPDSFEDIDIKSTPFGNVFIGSTLAHQLPEPKSDGSIVKINDGTEFPALPILTHNLTSPYTTVLNASECLFLEGLTVTLAAAREIEELTRKQNDCPEWHKLRKRRITSSVFKDVIVRRKDFETLANRLTNGKTVRTQAMKHGIENEANAVLEYATHKNVNVKPCGFIISPNAPFLGSSPDRVIYDPNEASPFGVLEVKCPMKESYKDAPFLKLGNNGTYKLKDSHAYYMQVMGQMALTGLTWGDFCVWTENDMHIERIFFNEELWKSGYDKLATFFFEHFMKVYV